MLINFRDIPGQHNLFLDYLYEFENVESFYPYDFRNREKFRGIFQQISESKKELTFNLSDVINKQYDSNNPSPKTIQNIDLLNNNNTMAILTGQQLGLFGGPLYTFYKIISAIKLCRSLTEIYDDYNFVPVFWLEGDDHDFDEIRSFNIIDKDNNPLNISYINEENEEDNKGSVGNLVIDERIEIVFKQLTDSIRNSEFTPAVIEILKSCYSKGKTFKEAFRRLIISLFDEYGLVLFDPQDKKVKELLKPVFKKEILDFRKHSEAVINTSAELEINYHAQVKVRPVNLFMNYDNGRFLIEPHDELFGLKRKRKKFTQEELLVLLEEQPEIFSPNVLLRPLCQDYLFPTAFYVGGPGEICYTAQAFPLYASYNVIPPVIYPRSSITILEKNISGIISKYNFSIENIFQNGEKMVEIVLDTLTDKSIDELFSKSNNQIELSMDELREKLFEIDKTISDASLKTKEKIMRNLDELKSKSIDAQKRKHEAAIRQIQKVVTILYNNNNLQERELNFIYFANKYGIDFIRLLFKEISINKFEHQVIEI